jgi:O-glycosyl hydrolase
MKRSVLIVSLMLLVSCAATVFQDVSAQPAIINLQIDGGINYQTMDGFGVNINPAWWYNGEYSDSKVLQPAIDLLVDSLGATIFRAVIEEIDWEEVNDDNDPGHFNWDYYNRVFSNERFEGVWKTLRYLNHKGITNGLVISLMGAPPASAPLATPDPQRSWMGGTDYTINPDMEDELVESMAALLYYMRHKAKVEFNLVSPMNETDVISWSKNAEHPDGIVEGPNMPDPVQYARVVKKLAEKLDYIGMSDIRFVAPDAASDKLFSGVLEEIVKDSYLMTRIAFWGVHQYGDDASNYWKIINRSGNPNKSYWVTETGGIRNMLGQLDDNASAFFFWDGYDCVYQHGRRNGYGSNPPNDWIYWIAGDEGKPLIEYIPREHSWSPRKQFYEHAQLMKFIKPGSVRIGVSGQDSSVVAYAYRAPDGKVVITGRNNSNGTICLNGNLVNLTLPEEMNLIYTDTVSNFADGDKILLSGNSFKAFVPAKSVFTITGASGQPRK